MRTCMCTVAMYTRASRSDYDDWETVYGNVGWGSNDLVPLLEKVLVALALTRPQSLTAYGSHAD